MLENPDILLSLVGVSGLVAVAGTALLNRQTTKDALEFLGGGISQLNASVAYVQGKIDSMERILSDGVISPDEVQEIKDGAAEIKDKIGGIINRG